MPPPSPLGEGGEVYEPGGALAIGSEEVFVPKATRRRHFGERNLPNTPPEIGFAEVFVVKGPLGRPFEEVYVQNTAL